MNEIKITGVGMPFWSLTAFFVKAYFALIAATAVISLIGGMVFLLATLLLALMGYAAGQ